MFISKRRFILKTCGTTTPLLCLKPLLCLVEQYAGFTCVEDLFYSRKNYKRPELQVTPHQNFEEEVNDECQKNIVYFRTQISKKNYLLIEIIFVYVSIFIFGIGCLVGYSVSRWCCVLFGRC